MTDATPSETRTNDPSTRPQQDGRLFYIVVLTLSMVLVAVIATLLIGLFNPLVDNEKIFAILGPAFQTIVGCFVGVLGSRVMSSRPPAA